MRTMSAQAPAFVCVSVTRSSEAIASDGSFAVVELGQLAFAPGSSGWTNAQGDHALDGTVPTQRQRGSCLIARRLVLPYSHN